MKMTDTGLKMKNKCKKNNGVMSGCFIILALNHVFKPDLFLSEVQTTRS